MPSGDRGNAEAADQRQRDEPLACGQQGPSPAHTSASVTRRSQRTWEHTRNCLSYPLVPRDAWLEIVTAAYRGQYDARVPTYVLPGFPPDELQIATTGQAGRATLDEAHTFYVDCVETFERLGRPLKRASMVLDFGVGWG